MIYCYNEDVNLPPLDYKLIKLWIKAIVSKYSKKVGNINFIFCSDNYLLKINQDYLQHYYFTDIITFNYNELNIISGDIYISIDTVLSNSKEYGCEYTDELLRVIIHGILHLVGFDDTTDLLQEEMTQKEDESLFLYVNKFKNK